jgi:hypothetical protein
MFFPFKIIKEAALRVHCKMAKVCLALIIVLIVTVISGFRVFGRGDGPRKSAFDFSVSWWLGSDRTMGKDD